MIRFQDFGITTNIFRGAYFYLFWHLQKLISLLIFFFLLSFFSPISLLFFVCCSACCLVLNRLATIMKIYQKFQIYLEVELVKEWVVKRHPSFLKKLHISPILDKITKHFPMRNHVKLGVFSKGTVLCGGCWLWAWQISGGLQTCIAERSNVLNG